MKPVADSCVTFGAVEHQGQWKSVSTDSKEGNRNVLYSERALDSKNHFCKNWVVPGIMQLFSFNPIDMVLNANLSFLQDRGFGFVLFFSSYFGECAQYLEEVKRTTTKGYYLGNI